MKMIKLYSLFYAIAIIVLAPSCGNIDLKEEKTMSFKNVRINLLQGSVLTPAGIKNFSNEFGGNDWFYNVSGLKANGFWEPKEIDIRQAEQLVLSTLTLHIHNPDNSRLDADPLKGKNFTDEGIKEILDNYLGYYRQYVGIIIGEERFIYFNSFPQEDVEPISMENDSNSSWIEVLDGGSDYWQILVGIDRNECTCLSINGEA